MIEIWLLLHLSRIAIIANAQIPPQEITCDPEFYGRPENQDCKDALARLPDWTLTVSENEDWEPVREFVNIGAQPTIQAPDNRDNNVRTPLVLTNGKEVLETEFQNFARGSDD